jgi:type VI secretion system protein ImpC
MAKKADAAGADVAVATTADAGEELGLLDRIIEGGRMARDDNQRVMARDLIGEFVSQILDEQITVSRDTQAMILQRIARIDELISTQLNEIMHHEDFQQLEGAWTGLKYQVYNTETSTLLKLRLLPVSKKELLNDLQKASEFDQSNLFKKIYEEEYGTFGGNPYGLLIGDFEFGRHPQDIELLERVSQVASAAHAPFISAASPKLFDMDSFTELAGPRDLSKIFESTELIKWRSFRESDDSRYVTLVMPRTLGRLPYGPKTQPVEEFNYQEDVDGTDHHKYLWQNAAYALGVRITDAFAKYKWCSAIRGVEGGGLVEGLPIHTFTTDDGEVAAKCPTEIAITDRREKELSDLGFIALCYRKESAEAAFFGGQTTQKPAKYNTPEATANARISSQLPYILAASRFAHYLKAIMRDKIGSFMTRGNVETFLTKWITQYVLLDDDAGQTLKARYPLREARIDVTEIPGKPGAYNAVAFLRPHFQLDELTASLRLVASLPPPAA